MKPSTGVLLVNLGTPDSPKLRDVHRYLIEFLTDPRVIDTPWLSRQLLVRGVIVPSRLRQSARSYRDIWTPEGSPLKVFGRRVESALQQRLREDFHVALAMRYQNPSIKDVLSRFKDLRLNRIIVLPLFPHYASATTGSVHQRVMEEVSRWEVIPEMKYISQYATHPSLIQAFCVASSTYNISDYDHVLFSFHGLPRRQLLKVDSCGHCLKSEDCCSKISANNHQCYSAQCHATAHAIAESLNLKKEGYSITFQSRLGKDPWLEPYTAEVIPQLARKGNKKVLVFCPAFVCDCLETTYEIGVEYAAEFRHAGGVRLDLVPGLNDSTPWIDALQDIVADQLGVN